MAHLFSAARLRRSPCFCRLTGVSLPVFDDMLAQLSGPWDAPQRRKAKPGRPWESGGVGLGPDRKRRPHLPQHRDHRLRRDPPRLGVGTWDVLDCHGKPGRVGIELDGVDVPGHAGISPDLQPGAIRSEPGQRQGHGDVEVGGEAATPTTSGGTDRPDGRVARTLAASRAPIAARRNPGMPSSVAKAAATAWPMAPKPAIPALNGSGNLGLLRFVAARYRVRVSSDSFLYGYRST